MDRGPIVDRYMAAFARGDAQAIEDLLAPDVVVHDSFAGAIEGRANVLAEYRRLFASSHLDLALKRRYESEAGVAQEFVLVIRDTDREPQRIEGIDCFEFEGETIRSIRAYVEAHGG